MGFSGSTIYLHQLTSQQHIDLSVFANRHDIVSYTTTFQQQKLIGTLETYGFELVYRYTSPRFHLTLSHSYTKQYDFSLADDAIVSQNVSASVYGYGNDLANWNDNITKANLQWKISDELNFNANLRIYWGMPGAIDMADYNMNRYGYTGSANFKDDHTILNGPLYSDGTRAFEMSAFLSLGLQYQIDEDMKVAVHGYDLLGLFDEDLNKRNFFGRTSHYRDTAPSFSVGFTYSF